MIENFIGVDYGSKLAGTTAITHLKQGKLHTLLAAKKEDADLLLLDYVRSNAIQTIFIDAPLSLPSALVGKGDNYFYRKCDQSLKAMSPMFLGGLTARAIKLSHDLEGIGSVCREVYPGGYIKSDKDLKDYYQKKDKTTIANFTFKLQQLLPFPIENIPSTYHEVDSIIAWYIGYRYLHGKHTIVGLAEEGQIII